MARDLSRSDQTDNHGRAAHQLQNMVGESVQFSLSFCVSSRVFLPIRIMNTGNERQGARQLHALIQSRDATTTQSMNGTIAGGNKRGQRLGVVVIQGVQAAGKQHSSRAGTLGVSAPPVAALSRQGRNESETSLRRRHAARSQPAGSRYPSGRAAQ